MESDGDVDEDLCEPSSFQQFGEQSSIEPSCGGWWLSYVYYAPCTSYLIELHPG